MRGSASWFLGAAGGLLLILAGSCVTVEEPLEEGASRITMFVTRAGDEATLSWQSDPDKTYTVLYADRRDGAARWNPLPGGSNLKGTGQTITLKDRVPVEQKRYYRLHVTPAVTGRRL